MAMSHDPAIPLAVVYNNLETFYPFLSRTADRTLIDRRYSRGDQALLWLRADKLVFASVMAPHLAYVRDQLGYRHTRMAAPASPTPWLSRDILREPVLLDQLVAHAGSGRSIQLVPYATTREFLELVAALRKRCGLRVLTPESPTTDALWIRDRIDTKSGFRSLVNEWLPDAARRLPAGSICGTPEQAVWMARQFSRQNLACVIKADDGECGIGHLLLVPDHVTGGDPLLDAVRTNPIFGAQPLTVEQFIASPDRLSPSFECFVPAIGSGLPCGTYVSNQIFLSFGDFEGVMLDRALPEAAWYPMFEADGLEIARRLQKLGYVGHFDLDAVVDEHGELFLLEVNARRTGGTHAHEFACLQFGADYLRRVTILSHNRLPSGTISTWPELQARLSDLLYPGDGEPRGIVITITSSLSAGEFGCCIIAPTHREALRLSAALSERLLNDAVHEDRTWSSAEQKSGSVVHEA